MNGLDQDRGLRDMLERIYSAHRQGLYALALAVARDPRARAEDAVHEAFVRLLRAKSRPNGDPVAYVFAAVRNAAVDMRPRNIPSSTGSLDSGMSASGDGGNSGGGSGRSLYQTLAAPGPGPDAAAADAEIQECLRRAVDELEDEDREVVVMKVYGGLTFDQIAQSLREPLPTVAARYRRALDKLRGKIAHLAG